MKFILLIAVLIVGHNCWPVDKDNDIHPDYEDNDLIDYDESDSYEDSISSEETSDIIKLPNYGLRAFVEPKKIGDSTVNPGEFGEFAEGDIRISSDSARSGLRDGYFYTYRWPRGRSGFVEVPLNIGAYFTDGEWATFQKAFQGIESNTCVRFVQYENQRDFVDVINNKVGCFATLGKQGGRQELNLQRDGCLYDVGTPAHELMHALGIVHEQSRPDRDNYVIIHKENIVTNQMHNFDKYTYDQVDNFNLPYGYDSVMHYPRGAFSENGRNTIEPKNRFRGELGQRKGPTPTDYKKINIMYGCRRQSNGKYV